MPKVRANDDSETRRQQLCEERSFWRDVRVAEQSDGPPPAGVELASRSWTDLHVIEKATGSELTGVEKKEALRAWRCRALPRRLAIRLKPALPKGNRGGVRIDWTGFDNNTDGE